MDIKISPMKPGHWPEVRRIFAEGIATGYATLETEPPTWEDWDKVHLETGRLVAEVGGTVAGWAALSKVSSRCVYAGVAEVSVYVGDSCRNQGIGKRLLEALIHESEESGIWTLEAAIFPGNKASIRLHKSAGFRKVGLREKISKLNGQWHDILLMERRSTLLD